jgi:hypothetical protein
MPHEAHRGGPQTYQPNVAYKEWEHVEVFNNEIGATRMGTKHVTELNDPTKTYRVPG